MIRNRAPVAEAGIGVLPGSESSSPERPDRALYVSGSTPGGNPRDAQSGEVVFAFARGVATVVTLSALTLVMVLLIIAEAVLMVVAEKIGLAPVVILTLTIMLGVGHQLGINWASLLRVLVFLWAF